MVLIVMVLFLGSRVYIVVFPLPFDGPEIPPLPKSELPADKGPGNPPLSPPLTPAEDWSAFKASDMFTYKPGVTETGPNREEELKLLHIIPTPDAGHRARIKTKATTKWYSVGDQFESYQLDEIDPETKCAQIWSTEDSNNLTICIEE